MYPYSVENFSDADCLRNETYQYPFFCFQLFDYEITCSGTARLSNIHASSDVSLFWNWNTKTGKHGQVVLFFMLRLVMTTSYRQKFSNCENFVQALDWEQESGDFVIFRSMTTCLYQVPARRIEKSRNGKQWQRPHCRKNENERALMKCWNWLKFSN